MDDKYKVKGSSIRSKFDFVRERFGAGGERRLRERFEGRPEIDSILDSSLYPFTLYDEVNRAIAEEFYDSDLSRLVEVGAYSAERVLTTIYKAFAQGSDFAGFLRRAATLHERFYSRGKMVVRLGADGTSCRIHLCEAPAYSEADLHIAAGFYRGAAGLMGIDNLRCEFELADDGAHYELNWS